jgi:hypothetical protein
MALSACGGDDGDGTAGTTTPTTAADTTAATSSANTTAEVDPTTTTVVEGPLDANAFDIPPSPVTGPFEGELELGGQIVASWYVTGDVWTVYFEGLADEVANGKCLGTALVKAGGPVHETSSPYGALACTGFPGEILPPGSVHRCGDPYRIFLTSTIPITEDGVLAAAIDKVDSTGGSVSVTSEAAADPTDVPELDFSGCQVIS